MVFINKDCINEATSKGVFGGARCVCNKCIEKRKNKNKLKPCPFCGGRAVLIFDFHKLYNITDGETWKKQKIWWIKCDECQNSQWRFKKREHAIEHWNTRF